MEQKKQIVSFTYVNELGENTTINRYIYDFNSRVMLD